MTNKEVMEACIDLSGHLLGEIEGFLQDCKYDEENKFQIVLNSLTTLTAKLLISCDKKEDVAPLVKEISESLEIKCAAWTKIKEEQDAKG